MGGGAWAGALTPAIYTVARAPHLLVVDGLVSDAERLQLDALGGAWDRFARWGLRPKHDATGFSVELPRELDPLVGEVAARIESVLGLEDESAGTLRFRRYSVGEAHPPHVDAYTAGDLHLVVTAMLVLVAPEAGGETRFVDAGGPVAVRPVAGRLVVWANHLPDGAVDAASMHDALPVRAGQKSTLTLFVYRRDRRVALPEGVDLSGELDAVR